MKIRKEISPHFDDYVFNWDYEQYLVIGGYGSGKSYHTAFKCILKLIEQKRKMLVVREVFSTLKDSCYDLVCEILDDMGILTSDVHEYRTQRRYKCLALKSPLEISFPNGSKIIFKGMDKPEKVKSINGVSIVWIEECSEVKYDGYKELQGRLRTPNVSMHFLLTCNPVNKENWVYRKFFCEIDDDGKEKQIVDEAKFYDKQCLVKNGTYYHHSTASNNPWLPIRYVQRLDKIRNYDYPLYMVARWGRFGASGTRVFPQFKIYDQGSAKFKRTIERLGIENMYFGFDFGFEESFNAVVCMSVDLKKGYLYIWDEIYKNHLTDPEFSRLPEMRKLKDRITEYNELGYNKIIVADSAEPKAIQYYRQIGFKIRGAHKDTRLSATRKIKRFEKIFVSPKCKNVIRELRFLTYKKKPNGDTIYDEFNIDPHTLSAIWYALDTVTVANLKARKYNHLTGMPKG